MTTLSQWRRDPNLIKAAQKLKTNKAFQQMLECLQDELPTNHALPPVGSSSNDFAYAYGREVGYRQALAKLDAMSISADGVEEIMATFEDNPE